VGSFGLTSTLQDRERGRLVGLSAQLESLEKLSADSLLEMKRNMEALEEQCGLKNSERSLFEPSVHVEISGHVSDTKHLEEQRLLSEGMSTVSHLERERLFELPARFELLVGASHSRFEIESSSQRNAAADSVKLVSSHTDTGRQPPIEIGASLDEVGDVHAHMGITLDPSLENARTEALELVSSRADTERQAQMEIGAPLQVVEGVHAHMAITVGPALEDARTEALDLVSSHAHTERQAQMEIGAPLEVVGSVHAHVNINSAPSLEDTRTDSIELVASHTDVEGQPSMVGIPLGMTGGTPIHTSIEGSSAAETSESVVAVVNETSPLDFSGGLSSSDHEVEENVEAAEDTPQESTQERVEDDSSMSEDEFDFDLNSQTSAEAPGGEMETEIASAGLEIDDEPSPSEVRATEGVGTSTNAALSEQAGGSETPRGVWVCLACTYMHQSDAERCFLLCAMCGTTKPDNGAVSSTSSESEAAVEPSPAQDGAAAGTSRIAAQTHSAEVPKKPARPSTTPKPKKAQPPALPGSKQARKPALASTQREAQPSLPASKTAKKALHPSSKKASLAAIKKVSLPASQRAQNTRPPHYKHALHPSRASNETTAGHGEASSSAARQTDGGPVASGGATTGVGAALPREPGGKGTSESQCAVARSTQQNQFKRALGFPSKENNCMVRLVHPPLPRPSAHLAHNRARQEGQGSATPVPRLGLDWAFTHALPHNVCFEPLCRLLHAAWTYKKEGSVPSKEAASRVRRFLSSVATYDTTVRVVMARFGFRLLGAAFFQIGTVDESIKGLEDTVTVHLVVTDPEERNCGVEVALLSFLLNAGCFLQLKKLLVHCGDAGEQEALARLPFAKSNLRFKLLPGLPRSPGGLFVEASLTPDMEDACFARPAVVLAEMQIARKYKIAMDQFYDTSKDAGSIPADDELREGTMVAVWNPTAALFHLARVTDSGCSTPKNATMAEQEAGSRKGRQMELMYIRWDSKKCSYVEDEKSAADQIYSCELKHVTYRQACDLELSFRCGYGLDEDGNELQSARYWYQIALSPGGVGWFPLISDLLSHKPMLSINWFNLSTLRPTFDELNARIDLHCANFDKKSPSGLPWDEVRRRVGAFLAPTCAEDGDRTEQPGGGRRALSLSCGRAAIACALQKIGWSVKVLDCNRARDEAHFSRTSAVDVNNDQADTELIKLDFLDFAVGVLRGHIKTVLLDFIDENMECRTFTHHAESHLERTYENSFMGSSKTAMGTNLRIHYLLAFLRRMQEENNRVNLLSVSAQATRAFHPLIRHLMEPAGTEVETDLRLNMHKISLSYCSLGSRPRCSFVQLWSSSSLHDCFATIGDSVFSCSCTTPCWVQTLKYNSRMCDSV